MENKQYLYWSFQSVHDKELEIGTKEFESFKNKYKKDFETRELFSDIEILEKYNLNAWRSPLYSKITSLILAKEYNGELIVDYITGEEKDLLQTFKNKLKNKHFDCQLVHFDAEIVLPYIGVRFDINGFNPQNNLVHQDLKYQGQNFKSWNFTGLDLKEYYKGGGKYIFSLEEIANIKKISHDFIHYDSEYTYYHSGDFKALKESAINKVVVIANVHREIFNLPKLEYKLLEQLVENVVEEKPTNWLEELYKEQQFTIEIIEGLKSQIFPTKKKPTKKEFEAIFETIRGVYVLTDFETRYPDSKDIILKKETEIKNVIESWK